MDDCVFCRIVSGTIPSRKIYEDDLCLAFHDIQPQAPAHAIFIPKRHIASLAEVLPDDAAVLGHMMALIPHIAKLLGICESGFRLVSNSGPDARQSVEHLHFHILGGCKLSVDMN